MLENHFIKRYYFHEKMGFHLVGTFHNIGYKFNTWYDMIWMEKIIGEHQKEQSNVRYGEWTVE
ncbi:MAG: GNAT family N-acetyltransferase [Clostridiales bacterium]|nr:GNAT family N-acetyltransferase [Clostridiales bacterium]